MSEENFWPDDGELRQLRREADEHARAWRIVSGLALQMERERAAKPVPSFDWQNARIHRLEEKIVHQRNTLAKLAECRAFEAESEQLLVEALEEIVGSPRHIGWPESVEIGQEALRAHRERKGPRPSGDEAS